MLLGHLPLARADAPHERRFRDVLGRIAERLLGGDVLLEKAAVVRVRRLGAQRGDESGIDVGSLDRALVDGVQVRVGTDGALSWLPPEDIESIRVLKDPSDLALYGSRGGSGVVIIRTKGSRGP